MGNFDPMPKDGIKLDPLPDDGVDLGAHLDDPDPHAGYQLKSEKGVANGYAPLGPDNLVPSVHLPASSGSVMKPRWNSTFTSGSTTTSIPLDNTIPQVGEGGEMIRVASVEPSSASNSVEITVSAHITTANTSYIGLALFLGSDTSATATRYFTVPATYGYALVATFIVPAWSGAKDVAVRVGPNTGGNTIFWGRGTNGSVYDGTLQTSIIVRELEV